MSIAISVIVPVYNVEKYLKRCLDSIINQSLKDIEIICVNDGSTDGSAEILDQYKNLDNRVIIANQENKGLSAARNTGMKIAQGEYISFVDSDDWIDNDFLEKLYSAAKKYDADAACASIERSYASGRKFKKLDLQEEKILSGAAEKYRALEIPRKCYVWNKIYKKSELDRQQLFFQEGMAFEDIYFTIRFLYFSNKIVTVPGTKYYYWVNRQSITREMRDKHQIDLVAARADFIKFSREHHVICDEKFYIKHKIFYRFFGILVLKIYEWETIKKYYLFGVIPFFEKRISL